MKRAISIQGRSIKTQESYGFHIATIALHFGRIPTDLTPDQVHDYLYGLQQRSKTPSQTFFKHTVFGLRFLLKSEGLPYEFLKLPAIRHTKKLPVVLSRTELWAMLQAPALLKHRLIIGLLYGCGLRCMELRNLQPYHLDFDRRMLHVVQGKGGKDRYVPLSEHLIRGIRRYLSEVQPKKYLFEGYSSVTSGRNNGQFSQRGVQGAVKAAAQKAGVIKPITVHMLRHSFATHLLEDGVNIVAVQKLLGHANVQTTMVYLHVCQTPDQLPQSPLDKLFEQCSPAGK